MHSGKRAAARGAAALVAAALVAGLFSGCVALARDGSDAPVAAESPAVVEGDGGAAVEPTADAGDVAVSAAPDDAARAATAMMAIGDRTFSVTLAESDAARAFAALLPETYSMSELNGNEKYIYLDESLPSDASNPGDIRAGDLMLYGDSCIVLFYEDFSTDYPYTCIGRVEDASDLAKVLGSGSVDVSFALQ